MHKRRVREYLEYITNYGLTVYMSFSVIDYIYMPSLALQWFFYRIIVVIVGLCLIPLIVRGKNPMVFNSLCIVFYCLGANAINLMIFQSGGYQSFYIYGLLMVTTFTVVIFRMSVLQNIVVSALSYIPTIYIIFSTLPADKFSTGIVLCSFLFGMTAVTLVFSLSDTAFFESTLKEKLTHKRQEVLTRSFPIQMRHLVKEGVLELEKQAVLEECMVGFIDIVSSTRMGNQLTLKEDWELKEKFLNCTVQRAQTFDMFVLNQLGDGILFISDPQKAFGWDKNLIDFYRHVSYDFENVLEGYKAKLDNLTTGLTCGATLGQVSMGFIGDEQSFYTVMGPTVNLAARLASQAKVNELVISEQVNQRIYRTHDVAFTTVKDVALKGFSEAYNIVKLLPTSFYDLVSECASCGQMMSIMELDNQVQIVCSSCDYIEHNEEVQRVA